MATHEVPRSVCLLVTFVSLTKSAEPIDMLFGVLTGMGPRIHILDGCPDFQTRRGTFVGVGPIRKHCNSELRNNG